MENKGFTLVEILAVIVILGLIITIAVPNIMNTSKKVKNEMYENKVDMIEKAAQLYGEDYKDIIENGAKVVPIKDLLSNNYLSKEDKNCDVNNASKPCIKDTRDNSSMDNKNVCVCIVDNRAIAEYIENSSDCNSTKCAGKVIPSTYTVTLNTNRGTINSGNITSYTHGVGATLPTNVTRTGYTFGGWYTSNSFSGSAVTKISTTDTGNKTYYAKWNPNKYKVSFVTAVDNKNNTIGGDQSWGKTLFEKEIEYGSSVSGVINGSDYDGWRGLFIKEVSCTNGYTMNLNTNYTGTLPQNYTIYNNNNASDSVCTYKIGCNNHYFTLNYSNLSQYIDIYVNGVKQTKNDNSVNIAYTLKYGGSVTITRALNVTGKYFTNHRCGEKCPNSKWEMVSYSGKNLIKEDMTLTRNSNRSCDFDGTKYLIKLYFNDGSTSSW